MSLTPSVTPFPRPTEAERGGGARLYWDTLPAFSDISEPKSYNCIKISYTKIQNKTTTVVAFTLSYTYSHESHLHIQKLYPTSVLAQLYAEDHGRLLLYLHGLKHMLSFTLSGKHMTYTYTHALLFSKHITVTDVW